MQSTRHSSEQIERTRSRIMPKALSSASTRAGARPEGRRRAHGRKSRSKASGPKMCARARPSRSEARGPKTCARVQEQERGQRAEGLRKGASKVVEARGPKRTCAWTPQEVGTRPEGRRRAHGRKSRNKASGPKTCARARARARPEGQRGRAHGR